MKLSFKALLIVAIPLLLSACGGSGGSSVSYTVPSCTDNGSNRNAEYNFMGYGNTDTAGYGLSDICASVAYDRDATGDGIKIAILDTGISTNSSDAVNITDLDAQFADFTTNSDVIDSDDVPDDNHGHGTNVAGIIAGEDNGVGYHGVAYDATLYAFKVFNDSGKAVGNSIATGIDRARAAGVDIMNLNLLDSVESYTNACEEDENGNIEFVNCFENFLVDLKVGYIYLEYLSYAQSILDDNIVDESINDIIQLFDSWSGVLSEDNFEEYVIKPNKRIISEIKTEFPHIPIIGFPKGAGYKYDGYIDNTGIDVIGVDYTVPVDVMKQFQKKKVVQGNLDPVILLGKKYDIEKATQKLLDNLSSKPFIFNM